MKFSIENKLFVFCLLVAIFVLALIIFLSIIMPSKEEFIEVYWKLYRSENLVKGTHILCNIENCGKSGVYRVGDIHLNNMNYHLVLFDAENPLEYDSVCIDLNQDGIYCDAGEGPLKQDYTFSIGTDFFSILNLNEDRVIIAHFPKDVTEGNFTVGFVIKSHYSDTVNLDVKLLVNETIKQSKKISIEPDQEITQNFTVSLSEDGLYKIKVSLIELSSYDEVFIDFWINKNPL